MTLEPPSALPRGNPQRLFSRPVVVGGVVVTVMITPIAAAAEKSKNKVEN